MTIQLDHYWNEPDGHQGKYSRRAMRESRSSQPPATGQAIAPPATLEGER